MTKKQIKKEKSIFFDYEPIITYEDFINKEIYKIFSLSEQKIKLSDKNWKKLEEEILIDYQAYKNLFDIEFQVLDDYNLELWIKDYLSILIIEKFVWFWLSVWLLRKIFKLLTHNITDIFEEKNKYWDGEIAINVLNRKLKSKDIIERLFTSWILDYAKYKKIKDKRDKNQYKESFEIIKNQYEKHILDYFTWNIKYIEKIEDNYLMEYLLFCILFLEEKLYLCNYKNNDFFIVNETSLEDTLNYPILIFSLNKIFTPLLEKYNPEIIKKYLWEYWIEKKKISKNIIPKEVLDIVSNTDYIKVTLLKWKDWNIDFIERERHINREWNKFIDLEKQFPFAVISSKNHKWKSQKYIVNEKIKLKKDNK
jgi:hypothetical protein